LGLRTYKTQLCVLALALRIEYLENSDVSRTIALPGELEAVLRDGQRSRLG
jgi:hypothetical protein